MVGDAAAGDRPPQAPRSNTAITSRNTPFRFIRKLL
jgi:hypothetical protein